MNQTTRVMWLAALFASASVANAISVTKALNNVKFADEATASGYVVFDTELARITRFDIVTTSGRTISDRFEYRGDTARIVGQSSIRGSGWPLSFLDIVSFPGTAPDGERELFLAFSGPLAAGELSAILYEDRLGKRSFERQSLGEHLQKMRLITGPEVVPYSSVPEPSALAYLALGLGLMWWSRARRPSRLYSSL